MIPGIGSMGGAELLILLVSLLILFFGTKRLPALGRSFEIRMRELRKEAARLGDEDEAKQRPPQQGGREGNRPRTRGKERAVSEGAVEDPKRRSNKGQIPKLIAYRTGPWPPMRLVVAHTDRDWMDATPNRFANRCLPLRIANQAGWFVLNSHALRVTWNGGNDTSDMEIESLSGEEVNFASSHFGSGILTWNLPFLFRTPPGYNLQARGPANWPKDGASPLEGIVETDWLESTFTMNWKLTRANLPVIFEADEPICMLVPRRRGELEAFEPEMCEIGEEPALAETYERWAESRDKFNRNLKVPDSEAVKAGWQKDYVRGMTLGGVRAKEHQTKLKLRDFDRS